MSGDPASNLHTEYAPADGASASPRLAAPAGEQTYLPADAGQSVLLALSQGLPDVPQVVLREDSVAEPVVCLQSPAMPGDRSGSRYQLHGEIARGGMGAILKGRDTDLGRDLAIKVLLDSHKDRPEVVRRFIEEAQIGGQLQHPGIVPVYELGQLADARPFFSMKLVKGQTLTSLLAARKDLAEDRPRFLGIFQQICQTLAYAHSRGVIHRDLKPANIMVGAFGEVQVMDWGLAKVLAAGGVADERKALEKAEDTSVIRTLHQAGEDGTPLVGSQTMAGSVMGTPGYMSPEQALGEVDRLDERADVFGLGAILCEVLTGKPPYIGKDGTEIFRLAARGKLEGCQARLQACGADADVVALALECLAPERDQRPRHAGAVADRISTYLASVESRLRAAELERVAAAARAEEALHTVAETEAKASAERRARQWQVGLAVVVVALTSAVGLAATWAAMYQNQLRQEALVAEQKAVREKRRADLTLADMQTARGLLAGERGTPAEAALWFAVAADQAAVAQDRQREEHNQLRARNWMRQATLPVAVLKLDGAIRQLEAQPGGDLLLVRGPQQQALLWSWREGKLLDWSVKLPEVSAACFAPDGSSVALGFPSGDVEIRAVADGMLVARLQHTGQVQALAFSRDGKLLAVGSQSARVWDFARSAFLGPVWHHPKPLQGLLFTHQGDRLVTCCEDRHARVFAVADDPGRGEPLYAPLLHAPQEASLPALVENDGILVTVTGSAELTRWDLASGKPVAEPIHTQPWGLRRVVASPDGTWFATGGYYGPEVHPANGGPTPLHLGHTNQVNHLAFSPDSTMLLSTSLDQTARLWSMPAGQPLGAPLPHMTAVEHCAWLRDARHVATAQSDGLIRVWRRPSDEVLTARIESWGQRPRLSFDGRLVAPGYWHESSTAAAHQRNNRLSVLASSDGQRAGPVLTLPGFLVDSCVCGDDRTVAAAMVQGATGQLGCWDIARGLALWEPATLPGAPCSVAARPASEQLAVLCATGDLLVFDRRTGKRLFQVHHEGWSNSRMHVARVLYTPDGKTLVSLGAGSDSTVNVREPESGQLRYAPLHPVLVPGSSCRSITVSTDSRLLATMVNGKNAAQVWDLATGRPLSQPLLHPGDVFGLYTVRFSPEGRYLLTGGKDGLVRYWDWKAGTLACPPLVHHDEVFDAAITPDGRYAVTALRGRPQRLQLWELATGRRMAPPVEVGDRKGGSCETVTITPDGRRALAGASALDMVLIDLEPLLSPPATATADLALQAELATTLRIEVGELSGLTSEQWQERWSQMREQNDPLARADVLRLRPTNSPNPRAAAEASARSDQWARRGDWSQAAQEALAAVAANPRDRMLWSKAAPRLLLAGDLDRYRQLCREMHAQFRHSLVPVEIDSLCKISSLRPDGADPAALPSRILVDAVADSATSGPFRSWFYGCLALVAYRQGQWQQAATYSTNAQGFNSRRGSSGALCLLVLAMAQHQLKQTDQARQTLAEAQALVPPELATLGSERFQGTLPVSAGTSSPDWEMAEILRREAALLLHKDASRLPDAATWRSRGLEHYKQGRLDEALAALLRARELEERHAWTHNLVGMILLQQGKLPEAIPEFRQAIGFAPEYVPSYINLGRAFLILGKPDEAAAVLREALEREPNSAVTHFVLGEALLHQGDLAEASASLGKACTLNPQLGDAQESLAFVARLQALLPRLDAYVDGTEAPADNAQRIDLARLCYYRKQFAASARFYAAALAAEPQAATDPRLFHRYNAACVAARAAGGAADAAERHRLRQQAIAWLRAELDAATPLLASSKTEDRVRVLARLRYWQVDDDLASLRDAEARNKLSQEEQELLRILWADVAAALGTSPSP